MTWNPLAEDSKRGREIWSKRIMKATSTAMYNLVLISVNRLVVIKYFVSKCVLFRSLYLLGVNVLSWVPSY